MPTTGADSAAQNHLPVHHDATSVSDPLHHYQQPPIHRLPPEVLHKVFLPLISWYEYLFCSRMVCRYWMEVIDSTPELWTWISNSLHPKRQAIIIRNSGNQLLKVIYNERYWDGRPDKEEKLEEYARLMKPTASRWHTLMYHQSQGSESNNWPLSLPLHNLKRISMDGLAVNHQRPTLDAPKLLYASINSGSVNLRYLSCLRVLNLQSTDCTLNELTVVLRASPDLQELTLDVMVLQIGTEGLPDSYTSKIHLPRLHKLSMSWALAESSSFLLDRIEAPSLETLNAFVGFPSDAATQTQLSEAAGRHLSCFPLPKDQKAQVVIAIRTSDMGWRIGERRITIHHTLMWAGRQAILASIASVTRQLDSRTCAEITSLKISCECDEEWGECLRILHPHFPRIDQILVEDESRGIREAYALLAIQQLSVPSQLGITEEWLFPKLAKLHLSLLGSIGTNLGNSVAELVKRRKETEQTVEISELRIKVGLGDIDPSAVEILSQSVTRFDLCVVGKFSLSKGFEAQ